jgi:hypothetical protein
MARNLYFSEKVRSEMDLYSDLVIEALKIYGQDVYYLPRDLVNEDVLLGDDVTSRFPTSHKIEMYIENVEGFDGEGDLFTRFGVEIRDEATFVVARTRFATQVQRPDNDIQTSRPTEGDLIYLPLTNKMFEINHVEHEQPFYQIENLPVYKMRCTLFEYTGEDFDTGVDDIQAIEKDGAYQYKVCVAAPKKATASFVYRPPYMDSGYAVNGLVHPGGVDQFTLIQGGNYYTTAPTVVFIGGTTSDSANAIATISGGAVTGITLTDSGVYTTDSAITVQFIGGSAIDSGYSVGDTVEQTLSGGVKITGEIQSIRLDSAGDSSRCYSLAHVGADDGKYHTFINDVALINKTQNKITGLTVNSVTENNKISETEQNDIFSGQSDIFLDFTENNPFGDPENQ